MRAAHAWHTFRALGAILSNLFLAVFMPGVFELTLVPRYIHLSRAPRTAMIQDDILTSLLALVLGVSVYRLWRPRVSKWLWLAGTSWYALGILRTPNANGSVFDVAGGDAPQDPRAIADWVRFTLPCLRTIAYSLGAFCASWLLSRGIENGADLGQ